MGMSFSKLEGTVKDRETWCAAVHGVAKSQTRLSNWTTSSKSVWLVWDTNYHNMNNVDAGLHEIHGNDVEEMLEPQANTDK